MLLGDVGTGGAVFPLYLLPRTERGVRILRLILYVDDAVPVSEVDYWSVSIGTLDGLGSFTGERTLTLARQGLTTFGVAWEMSPVVAFKAGDVVALRCTPTGLPKPLLGLRVLTEVNHAR